MTLRRLHRLGGLVLVLPLVVWMATGLLFHVKHRYAEAYEPLAVPFTANALWGRAVFSPAMLQDRGVLDVGPAVLATHPRGLVVWCGQQGGRPVAIDSASGDTVPEATEETARLWLRDAVRASAHSARYGDVLRVEPTTVRSSRTAAEDPAFRFHLAGGKRVTVDRVTGELSQTGDLNDFIDLTYRLHYLQWTPWKGVNAAIVLLAVPLVLGLALSGLRMALGPRT